MYLKVSKDRLLDPRGSLAIKVLSNAIEQATVSFHKQDVVHIHINF